MPAAQANLYTTQADVEALLSVVGAQARTDDGAGTVAAAWSQAINYATARVKFYCQVHYDDAALAASWLVNDWATVIAAYWLCARRLQPVPESLLEMYQGKDGRGGVLGDLKQVNVKLMQLPDTAYRHVDWPAWSNISNDARYWIGQARVQRQTSEPTPTEYTQLIDVAGEFNRVR